mmetsp:Transcript_44177/g.94036  ORF Transcript_44177/g.94036 Transcript_44177/m.94036 type:complete len:355 (-) Transcript_44177:57-1121(-)
MQHVLHRIDNLLVRAVHIEHHGSVDLLHSDCRVDLAARCSRSSGRFRTGLHLLPNRALEGLARGRINHCRQGQRPLRVRSFVGTSCQQLFLQCSFSSLGCEPFESSVRSGRLGKISEIHSKICSVGVHPGMTVQATGARRHLHLAGDSHHHVSSVRHVQSRHQHLLDCGFRLSHLRLSHERDHSAHRDCRVGRVVLTARRFRCCPHVSRGSVRLQLVPRRAGVRVALCGRSGRAARSLRISPAGSRRRVRLQRVVGGCARVPSARLLAACCFRSRIIPFGRFSRVRFQCVVGSCAGVSRTRGLTTSCLGVSRVLRNSGLLDRVGVAVVRAALLRASQIKRKKNRQQTTHGLPRV